MSRFNPNIELLEYKGIFSKFVISGISPQIGNALRRVMISETPTMAVDEIVILENTSVLFDEIIASRIGLIPLRTSPPLSHILRDCEYNYEECRQQLEATLVLEARAEDKPLWVLSGHLKQMEREELPRIKIHPVSSQIPIVKLGPGQSIVLEAYVRLGIGKEHAKWQPVSVAAYKYKPIVRLLKNGVEHAGRCVEVCPKGVFSTNGEQVLVTREEECTLCSECVKVCGEDVVNVRGDPTTLIFNVESIGQYTIEELVDTTSHILSEKLRKLVNLLKEEVQKVNKISQSSG